MVLFLSLEKGLSLPVPMRPAGKAGRTVCPGLNQIDRDVDVATGRFGVWASLVCAIHHRPCDSRIQARKAYIEARLEEKVVFGLAQIHFGIDGGVAGQGHLQRGSRLAHCADEAGRPTSSQQLFGIGATA